MDIQAMLVWLIVPFYDFRGFWSVAVNSVYKLQFFNRYIIQYIARWVFNQGSLRTLSDAVALSVGCIRENGLRMRALHKYYT